MEPEEQGPVVSILRNLLETCRESKAGFLRAASRSHRVGLKEFLRTEALQQAVFITELELELKKLGVIADPPTSGPAKLKGWREITGTRLLPSGDDSVLVLCEQGARAALGKYVKALQEELPIAVLELIKRQGSQMREAHERLHGIREELRNMQSGRIVLPGNASRGALHPR